MWIFLDSLDSSVISKVSKYVYSMVLKYGSLDSMLCSNLTIAIMGVSILEKCVLDPEYDIDRLVLKSELGGISIF